MPGVAITIETARLILQPLELANAEQIQALFPEITADEWNARRR